MLGQTIYLDNYLALSATEWEQLSNPIRLGCPFCLRESFFLLLDFKARCAKT